MKTKLLITLAVIGTIGIFGFNWINNFLAIDDCLDSGGSWNNESQSCKYQSPENEPQQPSLAGSIWISKSIYGGNDSLIFKSETEVTYFMQELSWDFRSIYSVEGQLLTVLTKTYEFEVDDPNKLDYDLKQQYSISDTSLNLVYLANLGRDGNWKEASTERVSQLNKYERIK